MEHTNAVGYMLSEGATESKPEIKHINDKFIRFNAVLQEGDELNRNKRKYPTKILAEGLQDDYIKERIATDGWFGECGHPITTDPNRLTQIDHTKISHVIKKVWMEGSKVMGLIETAVTPAGTDMKNLIQYNKMKAAFSMRGFSKLVENTSEGLLVKGPLKILTYDWVIHPSHKGAYMQGGLLSESTNFMLNESTNLFTEGTILSLSNNDIKGIMTKENNFLKVYDNFEFSDKSKIFYNESANNLFVIDPDNKNKFIVPVENYMKTKLSDLIRKM